MHLSLFNSISKHTAAARRHWQHMVAALVVVTLLSACGNSGQAAGPGAPGGMPAMPVTIIEAQPQQVPVIIEVAGQTEGAKEVQVQARVSGILTQQLFQEGSTVKKGATLFTIDRAPFEIALAQARAALAQDKANLEKAQREATRLTPLVVEKAVSQKEADDANSALITAQASLAANEARVRDAELNLSYTRVTAPISGITGRAPLSVGSLVVPGAASGLLTTVNIIDPIWVRFGFSESEALQLRRAGNKVQVNLLLSDGTLYDKPGKLNFTASTVDSSSGMVQMRAEFPNPDRSLLSGQFVRVQVTIGEREAYRVPQAAITQTDQGKMLFTVTADNTVAPRPVETDGWAGHDWVVTQGLEPGDRVIIDNLMKLRPGGAVLPHARGEGPGGASGSGTDGNTTAADESAQNQ